MVRKALNARERFGTAAIELFRRHGYADVTVAQIAAAAGLTERTFYRYFRDKPEVLFWRAAELEQEVAASLRADTSSDDPFTAAVDALEEAGRFFDTHREDAVERQTLIATHSDFEEREMLKLRSIASTIAEELRARGTLEGTARMAAEAATAIWTVAVDRWGTDGQARGFSAHIRACQAELRSMTGGPSAKLSSRRAAATVAQSKR